MTVEIFVKCDKCESRVQIPQAGVMPPSWIGVSYQAISIMSNGNSSMQNKIFCGWVCLSKFSKQFIREKTIERT